LLRKRKLRWTDVDLSYIESSEEVQAEDNLKELTVEKVNAAIEQLPDLYRIIFNLFAVDEVSQQEIAGMLNISHSNVRIIYHRAKKKLKEILSK